MILISSGDSFTYNTDSWSKILSKEYNMKLIDVSLGCIGNGLISKKLIYTLESTLKNENIDNILVGIMWGAIERQEFYTNETDQLKNIDNWIENPTNIGNNKNWIICNSHWKTPIIKLWYKNYYTNIGALIHTLQSILLTQWYLDKIGIKYFMSTLDEIFRNYDINHSEVKYLYKEINFEKFLPIKGCYEWVKENYGETGGFNVKNNSEYSFHPSKFGYEKFTKEIIIPYLKKENIL